MTWEVLPCSGESGLPKRNERYPLPGQELRESTARRGSGAARPSSFRCPKHALQPASLFVLTVRFRDSAVWLLQTTLQTASRARSHSRLRQRVSRLQRSESSFRTTARQRHRESVLSGSVATPPATRH